MSKRIEVSCASALEADIGFLNVSRLPRLNSADEARRIVSGLLSEPGAVDLVAWEEVRRADQFVNAAFEGRYFLAADGRVIVARQYTKNKLDHLGVGEGHSHVALTKLGTCLYHFRTLGRFFRHLVHSVRVTRAGLKGDGRLDHGHPHHSTAQGEAGTRALHSKDGGGAP